MTGQNRHGFHQRIAAAALVISLMICVQPALAAEKDANHMPVTSEIVLKLACTGDIPKADPDTFVLEAGSEATPMPEGAGNGIRKITVDTAGEASFGTITYERPDVYEYTVKRARKDAEDIAKDYQVYRVKVIALNSGEVRQIITKAGGTRKSELVYTDSVAIPVSAATGDAFSPILFGMLCAGSLAVILFLLVRRRAAGAGKVKQRVMVWAVLAAVMVSIGLYPAAPAFGKTLKVTLHRGGVCKTCGKKIGDERSSWGVITYGGPGATSYRWVSYTDPLTGKKETANAYCLEPPKQSPAEKQYSAEYINPNSATGKWKSIAKVLYFADDGPGGSELKAYLKKNRSKYPDMQSAKQRFALMHELLSYAYDSSMAFRTTEGRTLDASYQKKVKAIYKWCISHTQIGVPDPGFSVSPASAKAEYDPAKKAYVSETQEVKGSSTRQYFKYKVPAKAAMVVTHKGKTREYQAGATASVYVGDTFWFRFDASRTSGIAKTTVEGEEMQVMPYKISIGGRQDMGFYVNDKEASAAFSVALKTADSGTIKIRKQTESLSGETAPESDVQFRIWNASYSSYEEAAAASGGNRNCADTVVTDTDGIAISRKVAVGTYYVRQMTTKTGYRMMDPNPKTVTVTKDQTALVDGGSITDTEMGIRLRILKLDGITGEPITESPAIFGVYGEEACADGDLICTMTTATAGENAGAAISDPLPPGTVYVKELQAPDTYVRAKETKKIKLSYSAENRIEDGGEVEYVREEEIENWRPQFHDVVINKTVAQGEMSRDFAFDIAISSFDAADNVTVTRSLPGGEQTNVPLAMDGGKAAAENILIRAGGQIVLHHLPVGAKYTITERAAAGYKPSFRAVPEDSVQISSNMGLAGEPLSVTNKIKMETEEEMENVRIIYNWNNTREVSHALVVTKKSFGIGKNETDRFDFKATFTDLGGVVPGYVIYAQDENGNLAEEFSAAPQETGDTAALLEFSLAAGEKIRFFHILPEAKYVIVEEASDYIASYHVTKAAGTIPAEEKANAKSDLSLRTEQNTMPGPEADAEVEFAFENNADEDPDGNTLYVQKEINTDETSRTFSFTADYRGLKANTYYCYLKEGTSVYTLTAALTGASVKNQASAGTAGVPIKITRADGKAKYLRTGADGAVSFSRSWIARGGEGSVIVSWIGEDVSLNYEEEAAEAVTAAASAEGFDLVSFQADAGGHAAPAFALKAHEQIAFPMLPAGAAYKVTEAANSYEPSYELYRTAEGEMKKLDAGSGGTRSALATEEKAIPGGVDVTDNVCFTNTADTKRLKVTKTVSDGAAITFPFTAAFSGLSRTKYIAVTKGTGSARISIAQDGAITVTITGSAAFGGDCSGIPIKFIRGDGAARTVYTDASGKVAAGAYIDWLTGYEDSRDYRLEFLGQVFEETW
ncbi:MAG: hypothetical protein IJ109_02675 [Firmicutes bacterium]|nr:hypothetical protein [Bacillota bacterium]